MNKIKVGFAICGSFCTFEKAKEQIQFLIQKNIEVIPLMSFNAYITDTRFGKADSHVKEIEEMCGRKVIASLTDAEPVGPKKMFDIMLIEPCTGNTIAKLASGITDTPVTLAAKAHLRNDRPLLIAVSTNDALSMAATNIGKLLNNRNVYFVPMKQDDCEKKPRSVVADFTKTYDAILSALEGKQIQPIYI